MFPPKKQIYSRHSALEGKYIHGTCLPCTGVHYCTHCCSGQRRPWLSVRLSTGADYPAAIVLLRIGNRQSGDNRRSTSFCRWYTSVWSSPPAFPLHLPTLYVFKECLPATSVQACPPSPVDVLATDARRSAVKGRCSPLLPLMIDRAPW